VNLDEVKYWVGFSLIPGIGRAKFSLLENHFGELGRAWHAPARELRAAGLDSRSVESILAKRPHISLDAELEKLEEYKVGVMTRSAPGYPARLKEIEDCPPVLYIRGSFMGEDESAIAL